MNVDGIIYSYDAHMQRASGRRVKNQHGRQSGTGLTVHGDGLTESDAAAMGIDMNDAMTHEQALEQWGDDYSKDAALSDDIDRAPWEKDE